MHELADTELLRRYAEQDSEAAFAELVARHINLVYSAAARKTGSLDAAEEITQAVFLILAKKANALRKDTILSGWLYQTARLTAANFVRSEIRRAHRETEAYMQSLPNEPEARPEIKPLLEDAMGQLNDKERNAIVLRFFEGRSFQEIGMACGGTENAAKKRVIRGLEKLRRFFAKRGVNSTTAIIGEEIAAHSFQAAPAALAKSVMLVAAAKGATASASTLTLTKGALKVMAWTKAKTAAMAGVAIILITSTTILISNHFRGASPRLKLPTGPVNPMIAYGYSRYVVTLAPDGSLWSWGEERLGWPVLGLGNIQNTTALRRIGKETDWVSVAVGDSHCLAIKSDGSLWAWGGNFRYQLGDGTKITRPVPVRSIPGNDWKQAATAGDSSYAVKNDGTLWVWGGGYLGNGRQETSANAVQVGSSTNWRKVWAGGIQTVGLQTDGTLWFWGSLTGDSKETNVFLVPTQISPDTNWVDVCFGYFTVLALKSDGTLWSWGREANFYTQAPDASSNAVPMQVGTDNDWASCSSSPGCFYHLLRKKDGTLWAIDASEHRTVKPVDSYAPLKTKKIDWQTDIATFAAGGDDIGVILTKSGEIWTWGRVIGDFSPKDYFGPKGESAEPQPRVMQKPRRLSNITTSR